MHTLHKYSEYTFWGVTPQVQIHSDIRIIWMNKNQTAALISFY